MLEQKIFKSCLAHWYVLPGSTIGGSSIGTALGPTTPAALLAAPLRPDRYVHDDDQPTAHTPHAGPDRWGEGGRGSGTNDIARAGILVPSGNPALGRDPRVLRPPTSAAVGPARRAALHVPLGVWVSILIPSAGADLIRIVASNSGGSLSVASTMLIFAIFGPVLSFLLLWWMSAHIITVVKNAIGHPDMYRHEHVNAYGSQLYGPDPVHTYHVCS